MKKEHDKIAFTVRLTGELAERFIDYIEYSGIAKSTLVKVLIEQHLREYKTREERQEERSYFKSNIRIKN